jgi:hypothetical protein
VKGLIKLALFCFSLYLLLAWATNNPKSAVRVRAEIEDAADATAKKAGEIAESLTDKEE